MRARGRVANRGFTVLEMVVNLGLLGGLLLVIGALLSRTSETVTGSTSKLAAAERAETIRRLLAADLSAVPGSGEGVLVCGASETEWSLDLRLPAKGGGWREVRYRWSEEGGELMRSEGTRGEEVSLAVASGVARVESRWVASAADDREAAPESWSRDGLPGILMLEIGEAGEWVARSAQQSGEMPVTRFFIPVGGGPVNR